MTGKRCSFCGNPNAGYCFGFYCCGADDCERELSGALREADEQAREAAADDDFERYR